MSLWQRVLVDKTLDSFGYLGCRCAVLKQREAAAVCVEEIAGCGMVKEIIVVLFTHGSVGWCARKVFLGADKIWLRYCVNLIETSSQAN